MLVFFEANPKIMPTLGIANELDEQNFYEVLSHELCHSHQWKENSPYWTQSRLTDEEVTTYSKLLNKDVSGWETGDLFQSWLDKEIELCPLILNNIVERTVGVEFDCEKRTIELAQKLNLNINSEIYAQKANAYLITYYFAKKTRKWTSPGCATFLNEDFYKNMPKKIDEIYCQNITDETISLIQKLCIKE